MTSTTYLPGGSIQVPSGILMQAVQFVPEGLPVVGSVPV